MASRRSSQIGLQSAAFVFTRDCPDESYSLLATVAQRASAGEFGTDSRTGEKRGASLTFPGTASEFVIDSIRRHEAGQPLLHVVDPDQGHSGVIDLVRSGPERFHDSGLGTSGNSPAALPRSGAISIL